MVVEATVGFLRLNCPLNNGLRRMNAQNIERRTIIGLNAIVGVV
jgi:hypothetical protein